MLRLASVFYIDIASFAVLSNHYHLLLHVRRDDAFADTPKEIVQRALQIVSGNDITERFLNNERIEPWEHEMLNSFVDTWRSRLYDISWLMKFLNEGIARRANKEDDCTGHFWESRYKSQALLDEQAVLSCMAYIDLNPIRAGMAPTPEDSDYTSIQMRIQFWKDKANASNPEKSNDDNLQPESLLPFAGNPRQPMPSGLPYTLIDYLELVDWSGRAIREDKRGAIDGTTPPILQRLGISPQHWLLLCTQFESRFKGLVGTTETVKYACRQFGLVRHPNLANGKLLFS